MRGPKLTIEKIRTTPINFLIISALNVKSDLPNTCSKFRLIQLAGINNDERQNTCK